MKIIVALGNPGEKFKNTRHNIAWLALDYYLG
nr:aminoacyl-tRNA hydrolase [Patescibacteria group bacterium]